MALDISLIVQPFNFTLTVSATVRRVVVLGYLGLGLVLVKLSFSLLV